MPEGPARCLEPHDPRGGLQPVPRPPTLACMGHVAWLGTGLLGSGFVEGMLGRGERVVVLDRGRHIAEGSADDILNSPAVIQAYLGDGHMGKGGTDVQPTLAATGERT